MAKGSKTFAVGRNAKTGKLTTVKKAKANPSTHIVVRIPKKGRGDS